MAFTVFYSWQSWTDPKSCRWLIKEALEKAIKDLGRDLDLSESPRIDHDTKDEPGSPEIVATILRKIDECGVFVADLTFVAHHKSSGVSNPNVLTERGYALSKKGASRMIAVMNTAFGQTEGLPFDLQHVRHPITYDLPANSDSTTRKRARDQLAMDLKDAIRLVIKAGLLEPPKPQPAPFVPMQPKNRVSSFLDDGEVLCQTRGPTGQNDLTPILWHDSSQIFLRVIPTERSKEFTAAELLSFFRSSDIPIRPFGPHNTLNWEANKFGAVMYGTMGLPRGMSPIVQISDFGEIWGIDGYSLATQKVIPVFEDRFERSLLQYLIFATNQLEITCPLRVIAGFSGVDGYRIALPEPPPGKWFMNSIVGDCAKSEIVYEFTVSPGDNRVHEMLLPFFNKVWGTCGLQRPEWIDGQK